MKNKLYPFYILFLVGFFLCCEEGGKREKISICRIQSYYSPTDKINLSQFAESVELIFLETTEECMIQQTAQVKMYRDSYYIGSANMTTNKVFIFDKNGTYRAKVDRRGPGPEEYNSLRDFLIPTDSTIIVLTQEGGILTYNIYNGVCENRLRLDMLSSNFIQKDGDFYLFHRGVRTSPNVEDWTEEKHVFMQVDSQGTIKSTFYEPDAIMRSKIAYVQPIKTIYNFEDELYFHYPFCDTIFRIQEEKVVPHYYIDFGRNKIPNNIFHNNPGITEISKKIRDRNCLFSIDDYCITKNGVYYYFCDYEHNGYIAFYSQETGRTLIGHHMVDDLFFVGKRYKMKSWQYPRMLDGYLIWPIDSSKAKEMYEGYKKDLEKWNAFVTKYGQYIPQFEKIEPEDNPILFKVKLKEYI